MREIISRNRGVSSAGGGGGSGTHSLGAMPINGPLLVILAQSNWELGENFGLKAPKILPQYCYLHNFDRFFNKLSHRNAIKSEIYRF